MVRDQSAGGENSAENPRSGDNRDNPLFQPQRESAGSVTLARFAYQYDWALYEFLELYQRGEASIVFMEFHEDVVFSNSLEPDAASFIFCQVKAGGKSSYTAKSLTKRLKEKPSVLAKMFSSISDKSIEARVKKVRLVATAGFSLNLTMSGFRLEEIPWSSVGPEDAAHIAVALRSELGADVSIDKLHFHEPELANRRHDLTVMGLIAKLISERNPKDGGDSRAIYLLLNDELRRKGSVEWDYASWDNLVERKGLTGDRVEALFSQFCSTRSIEELISDVEELAKELAISALERRRIRDAAREFALGTLAGGSLGHIQAQRAIKECLSARQDNALTRVELECLAEAAPQIVRDTLPNEATIRAAYLIEYLRG
ncbi:dsDNA nuclease domain-containing protein [Pandoraea sp. E26]|uniref:dsDNA nuclease domain-containing protein n=1 Tax=Pandoraea sp. E26 TaxID=1427365 RepID=UPI00068DFC32|nr:dsDNA nuclease domain-containing protein [Pandoraea sp. E26]